MRQSNALDYKILKNVIKQPPIGTDDLLLKLRVIAKQLRTLADALVDSEVSCGKCPDCGESMKVIELYRNVGYIETIYECEKCMNS